MAPTAQKTLLGDLPSAAASPAHIPGYAPHYESPFHTVDMRAPHLLSGNLTCLGRRLGRHPSLPRALLASCVLAASALVLLFLCGAAARSCLRRRSRARRCGHEGGEEVTSVDGGRRSVWLVRSGCLLLAGEGDRGCETEGKAGAGGKPLRDEPLEYLPGHLRI